MPVNTPMLAVYFRHERPFPIEVMIPMRLIVYNAGSRKLLITTDSLDLPMPVVVWLQESPVYRQLIASVGNIVRGAVESERVETGEVYHLVG